MKNSETDRELTDLIRKTLDGYEEQYVLGSWENFARQRQRRRILVFWFTASGIAASLLIGWLGYKGLSASGNMDITAPQVVQAAVSDMVVASDSLTVTGSIPVKVLKARPAASVKDRERGPEAIQNLVEIAENEVVNKPQEAVKVSEPEKKEVSGAGKEYTPILPDSSAQVNVYSNTPLTYEAGETAESKTPGRRLRLGVSVSPGVASTTTSSAFAWAGGISADIPLTRRLRLTTGIQVERQSIKHEEPSYMSSVPAGSRTASLVDFDLPVNLTWKFYAGKSSGYYISGGVSSVLYLSEKYTNTSYSQQMVEVVVVQDGQPSVSYELENVKTTSETTATPLSNIDLAGRVNLIFGYEQHLSSRISLHFEPYLKLPLSGLAGQDMKYTTSGLNCRITF